MNKFLCLLLSSLLFSQSLGDKNFVCKFEKKDYSDDLRCRFEKVILGDSEHGIFTAPKGTVDENMSVVKFSECSLYFAPSEIFTTFVNLKQVILKNSGVVDFKKDTFEKATKLEKLSLADNDIEVIHENVFWGASSLEWLELQENKISELHDGAFSGLISLKFLYLVNNKLTHISEHIFDPLENIININFSYNQLEFLPENLFMNNKNLQSINFGGNNLNTISTKMFSHLAKLDDLYLWKNGCIDEHFGKAHTKFNEIENDLKNCEEILT